MYLTILPKSLSTPGNGSEGQSRIINWFIGEIIWFDCNSNSDLAKLNGHDYREIYPGPPWGVGDSNPYLIYKHNTQKGFTITKRLVLISPT